MLIKSSLLTLLLVGFTSINAQTITVTGGSSYTLPNWSEITPICNPHSFFSVGQTGRMTDATVTITSSVPINTISIPVASLGSNVNEVNQFDVIGQSAEVVSVSSCYPANFYVQFGNRVRSTGTDMSGHGSAIVTITSSTPFTQIQVSSIGLGACIIPTNTSFFTALPVAFNSFNYECTGSETVLNWNVEWEQNCDRYDILISDDGSYYDVEASVKSIGTSASELDYSYRISANINDYLLLRQVDIDGQTVDYGPFKINCENSSEECNVSVSLNQEMLFIYAPRYYGVSSIRLVDLCGAEISLDYHDFGTSLVIGMEIETLKSGTYFVIIQTSDQVKSLPFIKI